MAATDMHATIEELLEAVFSVRSVPRLYNEGRLRLEAGSNTSTVALRVVGGDEKGSLKSETVKYGRESHGPAAIVNDRPVLSSERAPNIDKPATD
jgi:hypothetical protein